MLGEDALHGTDQVCVEGELEDRAALGMPGQLGIDDLIRPGPEVAGGLHAAEDVRPAAPPAVGKGALHDDLLTNPHRLEGRTNGRGVQTHTRYARDGQARAFHVIDVGLLMREPPLAQQLQSGVPTTGRRPRSVRRRKIQFGEMKACEMVDQVAGAELDDPFNSMHEWRTFLNVQGESRACARRGCPPPHNHPSYALR